MHLYAFRLRPIHSTSVPQGVKIVGPPRKHQRYRHGCAELSRALTLAEADHFDLVRLAPEHPDIDRQDIARTLGMPNLQDPFLDFMCRVDHVITASNDPGLGVFDFADACWMDLYSSGRGDPDAISDEDIKETLAEGDDLYAQIIGLEV